VTTVRFLGSGNAFADGGRSHACIHVSAPGVSLLLDCGGSSLPMIKRHMDPAQITAIAVTHLHGDHFGGIPFLLDEQKWTGRGAPLLIGGPPSLEARVRLVAEGFGMDTSRASLGYDVTYVVLGPGERDFGGARIAAVPVRHSPAAEPHGLRARVDGKLIAYSGDASWSDDLVALAKGADLFICEASNFDRDDPAHISYKQLMEHRGEVDAKRIVLTHLGESTLAHLKELQVEYTTDGTLIDI
jgi:ribonuclease BN (tRNA processing enzyme)